MDNRHRPALEDLVHAVSVIPSNLSKQARGLQAMGEIRAGPGRSGGLLVKLQHRKGGLAVVRGELVVHRNRAVPGRREAVVGPVRVLRARPVCANTRLSHH